MRLINVALLWSSGTGPLPCFVLVPLKKASSFSVFFLVIDSSLGGSQAGMTLSQMNIYAFRRLFYPKQLAKEE